MSKEPQAFVADNILRKLFEGLTELKHLKDSYEADEIEKLIVEKEKLLKQLRAVLLEKNNRTLGKDNL
jgi:hypothetical protein